MSVAAGVVEGDEPTLILGVHVRPLLQQVLSHLKHIQPSTEHLQNILLTILDIACSVVEPDSNRIGI
jgi:hypothetical protein